MTERLLRAKEVRTRLGIGKDTLRTLVRAGRLRRYYGVSGTQPRYKESEVQALIDATTTERGSRA